MRTSRIIKAVRTAGLSLNAATELIYSALSGSAPLSFVDGDTDLLDPLTTDECALVVLTSGSTGTPKAVGLTAPALVASATTSLARLGAPRGAAWSLLLPLHHIAGTQVLIRTLINDGTLRTIDEQADFTSIVPTQLQRALHGDDHLKEHLQSTRAVLVGGASLSRELRDEAAHAGITVVTTYGMTETAGGCIYDGIPLDGVDVRITAQGLIKISGPMLAVGYLNDPEHAAFSDGWFTTSDFGNVIDGRVEVSGRSDDVINSGGEKISLSAVEDALRRHPMVIDAIACGAPDLTWGDRLIVGVVASGTVSLSELRDHVTVLLGRVQAPRGLRYLREIPRGALGKPRRAALLEESLDEEI